MPTTNHSKIRFIGYSIPATPADLVSIGSDDGPGSVTGTYLGNADFKIDISKRIEVLKRAVDAARAKLPSVDDEVTNVFVAPEFYFHGTQGPYVYGQNDPDPVAAILERLNSTFNAAEYPNWTFVFGSAITAQADNIDRIYASNSVRVRNAVVENLARQWQAAFGPLQNVIFDMLVNFIKNCHSYPDLEVRNRALIVSNVPLSAPAAELKVSNMTTEKYYVSNEDFLLYETTGNQPVVTEQMTAYPQIDLSSGDLKQSRYDPYAIFRQNYGPDNFPQYVDFAIEICLDHSDARLRRNIDSEPFPKSVDAVHVQLVPSCGMQIQIASVAADENGFVFNCDGQYALDASSGEARAKELNGVQCIYANYVYDENAAYAAHTQLARIKTPARGEDPRKPGSSDAQFLPLKPEDVAIVEVEPAPGLEDYFAGGAGAVHIYGLHAPYELYPE